MSASNNTTTKRPPSSRARDYFHDVGSKTEMKCGTCSKLVKAPAGYFLIMSRSATKATSTLVSEWH